VELGDFMAFVGAGNILLEYCIGGAAVARAWASYFATLLNHRPNDFRIHATSLSADYSRLDPIAVVVIALVCVVAVASTKGTSRFNYVLSIVHIAVILFIIVAGLARADTANMRDFTPFGVRGIFSASAVLFLQKCALHLHTSHPLKRRDKKHGNSGIGKKLTVWIQHRKK
jgi:basic amino acid/polyamine antiporter, APA family